MRLGSLFDGSGGFPLAASMLGVDPVWASEIEPYPIRVTKARFPSMKHLGDVTKLDGSKIEPVDIITFGSPCQDLSIAGARRGIHDGARSKLFFEAIRIVKEMRARNEFDGRAGVDVRPRFCVWENVPGAFSSNGGADFKAVLEAFCSVAGYSGDVPRPPLGKWGGAGHIVGDGFSIAWRVLDAQFWGVPQRRRRIFLVADFGGERAGEILFKREGLRRDHHKGKAQRQAPAADTAGGAGGSCYAFKERAGKEGGGKGLMESDTAYSIACNDAQRLVIGAFMGAQGAKAGGIAYCDDGTSPTIKAAPSGIPDIVYAIQGNVIDRADTAECNGSGWREDIMHTLNTVDRPAAVYPQIARSLCARQTFFSQKKYGEWVQDYKSSTLKARDYKAATDLIAEDAKPPRKYIVRRLTPLECSRLQGFPDWWEDGVEGSDAARYKMWGNGVALPCVLYVLQGITDILQEGKK